MLSSVWLPDKKVYTCVAENAVGRGSWIIVYFSKYTLLYYFVNSCCYLCNVILMCFVDGDV